MLTVLDLFSGIGGFSLGLERTGGFETVAFCEIDTFCRKVLAKHWPEVPIHEDVRELTGDAIGSVDVVVGGYPCQPFSLAGKRAGAEDDRHLWPEMRRLVDELRPSWVIGENVAGHITMGLDDVLSDLAALQYATRTFVIPACAVDAPHRRDRCWVVGYAKSQRRRKAGQDCKRSAQRPAGTSLMANTQCPVGWEDFTARDDGDGQDAGRQETTGGPSASGQVVADTITAGPQGLGRQPRAQGSGDSGQLAGSDEGRGGLWLPEPNVGRVATGVPQRVDRLRALGNAVVPQVVEMIGNAILDAEAEISDK